MTVAEALKVLDDASTTRRARTAFEALSEELQTVSDREEHEESSSEPKWPDAKSLDSKEEESDEKRQGRATAAEDGQGSATARKGSS